MKFDNFKGLVYCSILSLLVVDNSSAMTEYDRRALQIKADREAIPGWKAMQAKVDLLKGDSQTGGPALADILDERNHSDLNAAYKDVLGEKARGEIEKLQNFVNLLRNEYAQDYSELSEAHAAVVCKNMQKDMFALNDARNATNLNDLVRVQDLNLKQDVKDEIANLQATQDQVNALQAGNPHLSDILDPANHDLNEAFESVLGENAREEIEKQQNFINLLRNGNVTLADMVEPDNQDLNRAFKAVLGEKAREEIEVAVKSRNYVAATQYAGSSSAFVVIPPQTDRDCALNTPARQDLQSLQNRIEHCEHALRGMYALLSEIFN